MTIQNRMPNLYWSIRNCMFNLVGTIRNPMHHLGVTMRKNLHYYSVTLSSREGNSFPGVCSDLDIFHGAPCNVHNTYCILKTAFWTLYSGHIRPEGALHLKVVSD